jgi:16S rRNA pseudouridine516 synthase
MSSAPLSITDILFSQGFGTRRVCAGLVQQGHVKVAGELVRETTARFATDALDFEVQGQAWTYQAQAYVMLHKPAGYECSQKPGMYPSIYTLLPAPLRMRGGKMGTLQAVGRLDQDTTGLLLLSDDGAFIHKLTSPRHHVPKVYEVTTKHALDEHQLALLLEGVVLDDDPRPVRAAAVEQVSTHHLRLTLTQGKYHQVKRMLAAVSNRVEALHRSAIGRLQLDARVPQGRWRWLTAAEVQALRHPSQE